MGNEYPDAFARENARLESLREEMAERFKDVDEVTRQKLLHEIEQASTATGVKMPELEIVRKILENQ